MRSGSSVYGSSISAFYPAPLRIADGREGGIVVNRLWSYRVGDSVENVDFYTVSLLIKFHRNSLVALVVWSAIKYAHNILDYLIRCLKEQLGWPYTNINNCKSLGGVT